MLDLKNVSTNLMYNPTGRTQRFLDMKRLLDQKCAANLRLLATKNNINRASDYHYLGLAVTQSTEPVNGIDYIHPVVKPCVDYATAVIAKGLAPNGDICFEFVGDNADDEAAARQATDMVSKIINEQNDPHQILQHWIQDALLHKNGEMLISPVREQITRYVTSTGTADQLTAFEAQAANAGLVATRTSRRKVRVDLQRVVAETQEYMQQGIGADAEASVQQQIDLSGQMAAGDLDVAYDELNAPDAAPNAELANGQQELNASISRNTIYEAQYKMVGYNLNIRFRPIAQHYWMCNPTIINIQDQDFCGFYDPMSVAEAMEKYPGIKLEEFEKYAEYSNVGAYQAGSLLNNLALHARDSVPINGLPAMGYDTQDGGARQVTILTVWNRYDIDDDGEMELVETVYSGSYVISAKEVEFIPVANMCPRPLAQNFYGMSLAESVVPMQEYATAGHRAEIQLGLLTATPRLGVKPDRLDFEMLQDGEAAIFILDTKFNPATDIYQVPPPAGNLSFIDVALNRIQQDVMSMVGMTQPTDVFNPEVMKPGNSGAKIQMALSPNQIIQDNTVKNSAEGLKQAIWLVWRTLVQYADDYGVKKLAQACHPDRTPVFLDGASYDDMNFVERKNMHVDLALGMRSDENSIQRLQLVKQCQQGLYTDIQGMSSAGTLTPESYTKIKKPYADTLYVLGVKDCDTYLPSDAEVKAMIAQATEAAKNREPSPEDKAHLAKAELDHARSLQIGAEVAGNTADKQLESYSLLQEHKARAYGP